MRLRVLIDTRPARACPTGIGRYAATLASVAAGALGVHEVLDGGSLLRFGDALDDELELPALLEREGIDALHSPLFHLPAVLQARSVVTVHDAVPALRPELATAEFHAVWAGAAEAVARADAVVCPTRAAKADVARVLRLEPERVHVVPETPARVFRATTAAEQSAARRRHELGDGSFLFVLGALEPRKAPQVVLEALAGRPDLPPVVFVGPAGAVDVAAEARAHGVAERVRWLGRLPDEDLVPLLGAARALVFPTLAEGFGLPVVEAFATGTPVVGSDVPAVAEVAGHAALLVPPGDARALAEALARLGAEPGLADELRARGTARLALYSPAALRAALERLYDGLAAGVPA